MSAGVGDVVGQAGELCLSIQAGLAVRALLDLA
jgi:hypothetical protein